MKHVPRVSPYSPASMDPGFVEIGLIQLSQSSKATNVTHSLTETQTDTGRHTNSLNIGTASNSRRHARKDARRVSPCFPASIDPGFVEVGLEQLSQSVKTTNGTYTDRHTITGVHSNQDQIWFVKIREHIAFYVDRRS